MKENLSLMWRLVIRYKNPILLTVGGLLLGISYNSPSVWFLFPLFLFPLFHFTEQADIKAKQAFLGSWLFGFAFLGVVYVWVWHALPLDWLGIADNRLGAVFVFINWFLQTLVTSLFIGLWGFVFYKLKKKNSWDLFIAPSLWVVFEYLRMWAFSLLTLGSGSFLGAHFSSGFIGYVLANSSLLLQLARWGGVYTLSFTAILLTGYLFRFNSYDYIFGKKKVLVPSVAVSFMVFLVLFFPYEDWPPEIRQGSETPAVKVAALNTNFLARVHISREERDRRLSELKRLMRDIKESGEDPDIIIFPEASRFISYLQYDGELKSYFKDLFGDTEKLIIDSGRVNSPEGVLSRLYYYSTQRGVIGSYDKIVLVPEGEYTPYLAKFFLYTLGSKDVVGLLEKNRSHIRGTELNIGEYKDMRIGGLFCSEILSPSLYRELVKREDANMLINLASQSIFHNSHVLYRQTVNVARVHAVQNNASFIQASNAAPSFVLDRWGNVVAESGFGESSVLFTEVRY